MIDIVVDTACDLPEELVKEYDLKTISHRIYLKDMEYFDKKTISPEEVYDAMKQGMIPITSLPSPLEILKLYNQSCEKGNELIYIALSSAVSGTYQLAAAMKLDALEKYPYSRIAVIDSKSGSTAIGLIALQAAKLQRTGKSFDAIVRHIEGLSDHVEHIFMIQDLSWLIKGGRLSKPEGAIGTILNIKPILHFKNGKAEIIEKARGRKKALLYIVDTMEERMGSFTNQAIGISHAGDMELVTELVDLIEQRLGKKDIIVGKVGAALTSHLGVGGIGAFFFNKRPEQYIE